MTVCWLVEVLLGEIMALIYGLTICSHNEFNLDLALLNPAGNDCVLSYKNMCQHCLPYLLQQWSISTFVLIIYNTCNQSYSEEEHINPRFSDDTQKYIVQFGESFAIRLYKLQVDVVKPTGTISAIMTLVISYQYYC